MTGSRSIAWFQGLSFRADILPSGNGTGGSGQNLPAEFNSRQHVEGTLAMARSADPIPRTANFHLARASSTPRQPIHGLRSGDQKGMDAVKQIKQGDKMTKVTIK